MTETTEWILGYGSLMSLASAQRTMPSISSIHRAVLSDFERSFSLVSIIGIRNGQSNSETKEMAALSIHPKPGKSVMGCIFEIDSAELKPYLEREHRYRPVELQVLDYECDVIRSCWTVISQTDEEYLASMSGGAEEWQSRISQYYTGRLWGRVDILPMRTYFIECLSAAFQLGGLQWLDNMLDDAVLANGSTSLRVYLLSNRDRFYELLDESMKGILFGERSSQCQDGETDSPTNSSSGISIDREVDAGGNNILHVAAYDGNMQAVSSSLDSCGEEAVDLPSSSGHTALSLACAGRHLDVVKLLLEHHGNPNHILDPADGWTLLHELCESKDTRVLSIITLLLEHGANPLLLTADGELPSAVSSLSEVRQLMLHAEADARSLESRCPRPRPVTDVSQPRKYPKGQPMAVDASGRSALHLAVLGNNLQGVVDILSSSPSVLTATDAHGNTAMHYSAYHNQLDMLQAMKQLAGGVFTHGLHMRAEFGESALDFACINGHAEVVHFLLEAGCSVLEADVHSWTPLHYACAKQRSQSLEVVRMLLAAGARADAVTEDGFSPVTLTDDPSILRELHAQIN